MIDERLPQENDPVISKTLTVHDPYEDPSRFPTCPGAGDPARHPVTGESHARGRASCSAGGTHKSLLYKKLYRNGRTGAHGRAASL